MEGYISRGSIKIVAKSESTDRLQNFFPLKDKRQIVIVRYRAISTNKKKVNERRMNLSDRLIRVNVYLRQTIQAQTCVLLTLENVLDQKKNQPPTKDVALASP